MVKLQDDAAALHERLMQAGPTLGEGSDVDAIKTPSSTSQEEPLDTGPDAARLHERLMRRGETMGFKEAAKTKATGQKKKSAWDWIPFVATGREGIEWVDLFNAAEAFNAGTQRQEQRMMLEDFLDYHARSRSFMGEVGGIAGDAPVFMGEFATGAGIASMIGKKAMKTAGGIALQKALKKMAETKVGGYLTEKAVPRTLGKLAQAGLEGVAITAVTELPQAAAGYGRIVSNARRLQFQRKWDLSEEEARVIANEIAGAKTDLIDVLPQAVLDSIVEYASERAGAAIPFVAKLDAFQDDLVNYLFGKVGLEEGRKILRKFGFHGVWAEIGEEYLGAAARSGVARLEGDQGELFQEWSGSLPETFDSTLEMYVAFSLTGAARRPLGVGKQKIKEGIWERRTANAMRERLIKENADRERAGYPVLSDEEIEERIERELEVLRGLKSLGEEDYEDFEGAEGEEAAEAAEAAEGEVQGFTEEEIEALEAMTPEEAEEWLRERGWEPVREKEEAEDTPPSEETPEPEAADEETAEETQPEQRPTAEDVVPFETDEQRAEHQKARRYVGTLVGVGEIVKLPDGLAIEVQNADGIVGLLPGRFAPDDFKDVTGIGADFKEYRWAEQEQEAPPEPDQGTEAPPEPAPPGRVEGTGAPSTESETVEAEELERRPDGARRARARKARTQEQRRRFVEAVRAEIGDAENVREAIDKAYTVAKLKDLLAQFNREGKGNKAELVEKVAFILEKFEEAEQSVSRESEEAGRDRTVAVWSRSPGGMWLIERSYALHHAQDALKLGEEGQATTGEDGREYAWFPPGVDPNEDAFTRQGGTDEEGEASTEEEEASPVQEEESPARALPDRDFASGLSRPDNLREFLKAGEDVGAVAGELSKRMETVFASYVEIGGRVFVDSGAFSAFRSGKPITDWRKVIDTYWRIARQIASKERRADLWIVAPDIIADQDATLQLQGEYRGELQALADYGVTVLLPLQTGPRTPAAMVKFLDENVMQGRGWVPAFAYNEAAWEEEAVLDFVRKADPNALHLLGLGGKPLQELSARIQKAAGGSEPFVTGDSNKRRAIISQGSVKARQDEVEGDLRRGLSEALGEEALDDEELARRVRAFARNKAIGEEIEARQEEQDAEFRPRRTDRIVADFTPKEGQRFDLGIERRDKWLAKNVPAEQLAAVDDRGRPRDSGIGYYGEKGGALVYRTNDGTLIRVDSNDKGPFLLREIDPADPQLKLKEEQDAEFRPRQPKKARKVAASAKKVVRDLMDRWENVGVEAPALRWWIENELGVDPGEAPFARGSLRQAAEEELELLGIRHDLDTVVAAAQAISQAFGSVDEAVAQAVDQALIDSGELYTVVLTKGEHGALIQDWHREHHKRETLNLRYQWAVAVAQGRRVVAIATVGTPSGRWGPERAANLVELQRIISSGEAKNASSAAAAAAIEHAKNQGKTLITYSEVEEAGSTYWALTSPRKDGYHLRPVAVLPARSGRTGADEPGKIRWEAGPLAGEAVDIPGPVQAEEVKQAVEDRAGQPQTDAQALFGDEAIRGEETLVELPDGRSLSAVYVLVEADWITPTHDPTAGFKKNPDGDLNERPYEDPTEGRASRETVEQIARKPRPGMILTDDPTAHGGPPIVTRWGVVLGGNARSMGMQLAYHEGGQPAEQYRKAMLRAAPKFGLSREDVEGFEKPVIVRELAAGEEGARGELSRVLNQSHTTARTGVTDAVARGRLIDEQAASEVAQALGDGTLSAALGQDAPRRRILSALVRSGAFTEADLQGMLDPKGNLTKSGRDQVEQALLGAVVPDVRALASLAPGHRNKLLSALPSLVRLSRSWDAFPGHLAETADALATLRQSKQPLSEALRQATIEDEAWKRNPVAVLLANALQELGPRQFAGRMQAAVEGVQDAASGQGGLFEGAVPKNPWDALRVSLAEYELELPEAPAEEAGGGNLLGSPMPAGDQAAARGAREERRATRRRRSSTTARQMGSGPVQPNQEQAARTRPTSKKDEPVVTNEWDALTRDDIRLQRTLSVLRKFGIERRSDDPKVIRRTMREAIRAANGVGRVDLTERDNLHKIISDLARRLGVGKPGTAKAQMLRRFAAGFYRTDAEGIRLRRSSYVATFVHELGHHLHKVIWPRRRKHTDDEGKAVPAPHYKLAREDFPKQMRDDLALLGKDLYGDRKPTGGYTAEGWAEVVRFLVTNPAHLKKRTPNLYRQVMTLLSQEHPETLLVLQEARARLRAFVVGQAENPVRAHIARGKEEKSSLALWWNRNVSIPWFDRLARVRLMLEDLGLMDEMPAHLNPYLYMRRVMGHVSDDTRRMIDDGPWDPADPIKKALPGLKGLHAIFEPIAAAGDEALHKWEDYQVAKRVLEKRAQGYEVLPSDPRLEGTSDAQLREWVQTIEHAHPEFVQASAEFQAFNQWLIGEYAVYHGLLSTESATRIIAKNQEYITFRYKTTEDGLKTSMGAVKGKGVPGSTVNLGSGVRHFKNSVGEPLIPPLAAFEATMQGIVGRAHHNQAARLLLTLADNPDTNQATGRWFQRIETPMQGNRVSGEELSEEVQRQLGIRKTKDGEMIVPGELAGMDEAEMIALIDMIDGLEDATFWSPSNMIDEERQHVTVLVGGKRQHYEVAGEPILWETLRGFYSPVSSEGFVRFLQLPARLLRAGATQNNVSFGLMNVVRDTWQALTLTTTNLSQLDKQTKARLLAVREAFKHGDWANLFLASGADMAGIFGEYYDPSTGRLDFSSTYEDKTIAPQVPRHVKRGRWGKAAKEATLLPMFGRINARLEMMTRMGEFILRYQEAEAQGKGQREALALAGHAAANITLDFQKGGVYAKRINNYIPFFNAAVLGTARIGEHFYGAYKARGMAGLAGAFSRVVSFMVIPSLLQFLMVWDDEDYWNIDQKKRDRHWYWPTGRTDAGEKTYLRLPKPYGLAAFAIATERTFADLFGIDPQTGKRSGDPKAWEGFFGSIVSELSPTFSIAGVLPVFEIMAGEQGYDFYWDNEIVPLRDKDLPLGMQGAERSSRFARMLGGFLDYPPAKIDHLIQGFGAGTAQDYVRIAIDPIVGLLEPDTTEGEPMRREDWPILRRFLDSESRGGTEAVERFYEDWEEVEEARRGLNRKKELFGSGSRQVEEYQALHRYHLERYTAMGRHKRTLSKHFKELRRVYREVTDPDELEREILRIKRAINAEARKPYAQ